LSGDQLYLLITGYIASFFIAWCIGANDASNPTDTAVGSGALSLNKALVIFSIFTCLGAFTQGWMVMKTIGKGVVDINDIVSALVAVFSAGLWIIIASWKGLPISTTQSISGAVVGVGLAHVLAGKMDLWDINWRVLYNIVLSWIISPITSMSISILLFIVFEKILLKKLLIDWDKALRYTLIASLALSAYSFGANDVANATGVYIVVTEKTLGIPSHVTMLLLSILGGLGISLGGFTLGKRVIATVAYKITRLDLVRGAAAELSNALTVWLYTTIPYMLIGYGMPVSTTHASVFSIIGVGLASEKRFGSVNWRTVLTILFSWMLTLPITILASLTLRYGLFKCLGI